MSDEKYFKLDPARMGFRFLGAVPSETQPILKRAFQILKRDMGAGWDTQLAQKEIFWLNVWQDRNEAGEMMALSDKKVAGALDAWSRAAVSQYCEAGAIIDGYGFVVNPVGSKPQIWHVDYTTDAAAIWVPMTPFTEKNATQFITLPADTPDEVLEEIASDVDSVNVRAIAKGVAHYRVQQIAAQPMSVLYMERGTIHRGVANTGKDHRVAFYVTVHFIKNYENYPYYRSETPEPGLVVFGT